MGLTPDQIKQVCKSLTLRRQHLGQAEKYHQRAQAQWHELIRLLKEWEPEDTDRERVIDELRKEDNATTALIQDVHDTFDFLDLAAKAKQAVAPNRRMRVVKAAVEQAMAQKRKGQPHISKSRAQTAKEIEQQLEKGDAGRSLIILKAKIDVWFGKVGQEIWPNEDLMTMEEAGSYFVESYIPRWRKANPLEKKANGNAGK